MSVIKDEMFPLGYLEEASLISAPEKNLRSKVESILRSLQNLEAKKRRIDYEIKKQKFSLEKKRKELLRNSKRLRSVKKSLSESSEPDTNNILARCLDELRRLDSIQLQESDLVLNRD